MSKKKNEKFESNDFDFGDDLDLDMPDFNSEPATKIKDDRKTATVKLAVDAGKGFIDQAKSPSFIKELIRKSLPRGYGQAIDLTDTTADNIRGVYSDAAKEIKPAIVDLKRVTAKILPAVESVLPRAVTERIKKWTNPKDGFKDLSKEEQQNAALQMQLGEIFQMQAQADVDKDSQDSAKSVIQDAVDHSRYQDMFNQLDAMRISLQQLANYQNKIGINYQRKSLELQFRSYFLAQEALEEHKKFHSEAITNLIGILKNTGLPEFVKLQLSERFKESLRNKFIDTVGNSIIGKRREFFKNALGKVGKAAKEKISEFVGNVRTGVDMAEQVKDMNEMMAEMGVSGSSMAAGMAGGATAEYLSGKVNKESRSVFRDEDGNFRSKKTNEILETPSLGNDGEEKKLGAGKRFGNWIREKFIDPIKESIPQEKLDAIEKWSDKISYGTENLPQHLTAWHKNREYSYDVPEREGWLGKLLGLFDPEGQLSGIGDVASDAISSTIKTDNTLIGDNVSGMQGTGIFNRGTNKSITEIIPGYLSRIYQELQIIRTGDDKVELTKYDFDNNAFATASKIRKQVLDKITGTDNNTIERKKELDKFIKEKRLDEYDVKKLEELQKMTPEERTENIKKYKLKKFNNFKPEDFSKYKYLKEATTNTLAERIKKNANELIDAIEKDKPKEGKLNSKERAYVVKKFLNDNLNGVPGDFETLSDEEHYVDYKDATGREKIAEWFKGYADADDGKGGDAEVVRARKQKIFARAFSELGSMATDQRSYIQDLVNVGHRDIVESLGILKPGKNEIVSTKLRRYQLGTMDDEVDTGYKIRTAEAKPKRISIFKNKPSTDTTQSSVSSKFNIESAKPKTTSDINPKENPFSLFSKVDKTNDGDTLGVFNKTIIETLKDINTTIKTTVGDVLLRIEKLLSKESSVASPARFTIDEANDLFKPEEHADGGVVGNKKIALKDIINDNTKHLATGGLVDTKLMHGEKVLPPDEVKKIGVEKLDKIKDATHTKVQHLATGGKVKEDATTAKDVVKAIKDTSGNSFLKSIKDTLINIENYFRINIPKATAKVKDVSEKRGITKLITGLISKKDSILNSSGKKVYEGIILDTKLTPTTKAKFDKMSVEAKTLFKGELASSLNKALDKEYGKPKEEKTLEEHIKDNVSSVKSKVNRVKKLWHELTDEAEVVSDNTSKQSEASNVYGTREQVRQHIEAREAMGGNAAKNEAFKKQLRVTKEDDSKTIFIAISDTLMRIEEQLNDGLEVHGAGIDGKVSSGKGKGAKSRWYNASLKDTVGNMFVAGGNLVGKGIRGASSVVGSAVKGTGNLLFGTKESIVNKDEPLTKRTIEEMNKLTIKEYNSFSSTPASELNERFDPNYKAKKEVKFKGLFGIGKDILSGVADDIKGSKDVYIKGEVIPRLAAWKLKAGLYKDKLSGKVIKTYKDIVGDVIDENGNIVLTAEDAKKAFVKHGLTEKLITGLGTVIKKTMDFGGSVINKLPTAYGAAINLAKWGYGLTKLPQDVYVKGKKDPVLLSRVMSVPDGYISSVTGKMIKNPGDIDGPVYGPVINGKRETVLTMEDLQAGLVDYNGKPLRVGLAKIAGFFTDKINAVGNFIKKGAIAAKDKVKAVAKHIKDGVHFGGLHVGGISIGNPMGTSNLVIKRLTQIRDLLNIGLPKSKRQEFNDMDDLKDYVKIGDKAKEAVKALQEKAKAGVEKVLEMNLLKKAKDQSKNIFSRVTKNEKVEAITGKIIGSKFYKKTKELGNKALRKLGLDTIILTKEQRKELTPTALKNIMKYPSAKFNEEYSNSTADELNKKFDPDYTLKGKITKGIDKAKAKLAGITNTVKKSIGLKSNDPVDEEAIIAARETENTGILKKILTVLTPKTIRKGSYEDEVVAEKVKEKDKDVAVGKDRLPKKGGKGILGTIAGLFGKKNDEKKPGESGLVNGLGSAAGAGVGGMLASGAGKLWRGIKGIPGKLLGGGASLAGNGAGAAAKGASLAGNGAGAAAKGIGGKLLGTVGKRLGLAGAAYGGYEAYQDVKKGDYTSAVLDGGMALGGLAMSSGALVSGVSALLAMPFALPVLAAVAVGGAGYLAYRYLTKKKLTPLSKIRYAQYGFLPTDEDHLKAVFGLEDLLTKAVTYTGNVAQFDGNKILAEDITKIFDVDLKNKEQFIALFRWISNRFKPIFLTHLTALKSIGSNKKLDDIEDLTPVDKKKYIEIIKSPPSGVYQFTGSPFPKDSVLYANTPTVNKLIAAALVDIDEAIKKTPGAAKTISKFKAADVIASNKKSRTADLTYTKTGKIKTAAETKVIIDKERESRSWWKKTGDVVTSPGVLKTAAYVAGALGISSMVFGVGATAAGVGTIASVGVGMGASLLGGAAAVLIGIASFIATPVVLSALAIGLTGYGLYKGYEYLTKKKLNTLSTVRYAQYGFLPGDTEHLQAVFSLEDELLSAVEYSQGMAQLSAKKVNVKACYKLFGIDHEDKESIAKFLLWINSRFKPIFLVNLSALNYISPNTKLANVNSLSPEEKKNFLDKAKYPNGPYDKQWSPFPNIAYLQANKTHVEYYANLAYKEIKDKSTSKKQPPASKAMALSAAPKKLTDSIKPMVVVPKKKEEKQTKSWWEKTGDVVTSPGVLKTAAYVAGALGISSMVFGVGATAAGVGTVASMGAGLIAGTAGVIGSAAIGSVSVLIGIASFIGLPVALTGLALFGAYKGYKYLTKKKLNTLSTVRYAQYGFLPGDEDHLQAVFSLEDELLSAVEYSQGMAQLITKKIDVKSILKLFNIDHEDKESIAKFMLWINDRFKPVYLVNLSALNYISPNTKLANVNSLSPEEKKNFLDKAKYPNGPYDKQWSPFPNEAYLKSVKVHVDYYTDLAYKEIESKKVGGNNTSTPALPVKAVSPVVTLIPPTTKGATLPIGNATPIVAKPEVVKPKVPILPATLGKPNIVHKAEGGLVDEPDVNLRKTGKDTVDAKLMHGEYVLPTDTVKKVGVRKLDALKHITHDTGGVVTQTIKNMVSDISPKVKTDKKDIISVTGAISNLSEFNKDRIDALTTIRYKTYGLNDLELEKVKALDSLELYMSKHISYKGNIATWTGSIHSVVSEIGSLFEVSTKNSESTANFTIWFKMRFLPTYLNFATAVAKITGSKNTILKLGDIKPQKLLDIANIIYTSKTTDNDRSVSVWDISSSPWSNYVLNMDIKSIDLNLQSIKIKVKGSLLNEETAKNTVGLKSDKNVDNDGGAVSSIKKSYQKVKDTIANAYSAASDKASNTYHNVRDKVAGGYKKASDYLGITSLGNKIGSGVYDLVHGGGDIKQPGHGTGGDINAIPKPTGSGTWDAVKGTILSAAKMVGVDGGLMGTMASIESGYKPAVKAKTSSATGLYQFIKGTWNLMLKKYGAKYGIDPKTPPTDPRANALLGAEFTRENIEIIKSAVNRPLTDTDVYLAHFLGTAEARKLLKADPAAIAATIMPDAARANRTIFYNADNTPRTVAEVYSEINRRVRIKGKPFETGVNGTILTPTTTVATTAPVGGAKPMPPKVAVDTPKVKIPAQTLAKADIKPDIKPKIKHPVVEKIAKADTTVHVADGGEIIEPDAYSRATGLDTVNAKLMHGEYVLPTDTVRHVGVDKLDALKEATHKPSEIKISEQTPGLVAAAPKVKPVEKTAKAQSIFSNMDPGISAISSGFISSRSMDLMAQKDYQKKTTDIALGKMSATLETSLKVHRSQLDVLTKILSVVTTKVIADAKTKHPSTPNEVGDININHVKKPTEIPKAPVSMSKSHIV